MDTAEKNNKQRPPIGVVVRNLSRVISRRADECTGRKYLESLTGTNGWIIGFLARNSDRPIYQKDIEETFSVRRSTVSRVVSLMEQKGLVERRTSDSDGRLKELHLTDRAWEIHKKIQSDLDLMEEKLRGDIPEEELEVFFTVAKKMMNNLGDDGCPCGRRHSDGAVTEEVE